MKKALVFLFACLSSILMFAQAPQTHWTGVNVSGGNMLVNAVLQINGVEQTNPNLEIGVFDSNNGECRGAQLPLLAPNGRYLYQLIIYGNTGDTYTFKVWDHEYDQEMPLSYIPNEQTSQIVYSFNAVYGGLRTPYSIDFTSLACNFTKDITAYTEGQKDHYYFIASPIGEVNPTNVTNMLENSYDLYYFDQSASDSLEWINYENPDNDFTTLTAKKGYLYANSGDGNSNVTTLTFAGTPYNGDGTVLLDYDANAQFAGWNLIGNPFGTEASLNMPFYRMNGDGTGLSAQVEANSIVGVMEGVFVKATGLEQSAVFTTSGNGESMAPVLNINVGRNRGTSVDNAIIRFDEGCQLPKFQLNSNHTKLFIPQGENSFAVVRSASEGEMPVNFKAESNGTYTINFNAENVKMNYLHLIDNLTGANVDLLVNPSYTFEAKTTDYASRFKLVFACGDASDDNETFAYYNGSEWVISNMGEATLQVVDVMGRVLSTETVNGNATMHMNQTLGVYMLRLVNGDSVKVQKVVVR